VELPSALGDLLAVCGALQLFFSWVATNTFGEKLKSAKSAYQDAQRDAWQLAKLREMHQSIDSVASAVIQAHKSLSWQLRSSQLEGRELNRLEEDDLRNDLALTGLSAAQIDWVYKGVQISQGQFLRSGSRSLERLFRDVIEPLRALTIRKDAILCEMQENYGHRDRTIDERREEHSRLRQRISQECLEPFPALVEVLVDVTNEESELLRRAQQRSEKIYKRVKQAALVLYVIGSMMTITGTVVSKVMARSSVPFLAGTSNRPS
jgi:hypothetical protein